ncbi:MAG: translation initiation factor IF-2 [Chloroflexota bacterium]
MSEKVEETPSEVIELPSSMSVRDLAEAISGSPIDIIKTLMANGVMANINQQIDYGTAEIVAAEMGFEVSLEKVDQLEAEDIGEIPLWRRLIASEDKSDLVTRPPVVTILGHVDHGKTTLLDAIRKTSVASGEVGGITQHINAYQVSHNDRAITFLDTPGHAAFTAMRSRGAQGADVVILVVAADDGVMPQTREALAHARAAKVPMIVAMTKMDKENANPDRVKQQLADAGLIPDDWDGDTIVVPVSGTKGTGLEDLLEAILLISDNIEILANPNGDVIGTVIEAERDPSKGVVATILVQNGTLRTGNILVAGTTKGRLRAMVDYHGQSIDEAGPSKPISVLGLKDVPEAGDLFRVVETEKEARTIIADRKEKAKQSSATPNTVTLENMFERYQAGEARELRLVIKADVQGSLDPIVNSLQEMSADDKEGEISVNVLHSQTGNIGENDVMLAVASKAIIMGFNVKADNPALRMAERDGVSIRTYDIIYRLTEDVEKALKGMLEPEEVETVIGKAEVRAVFKISRLGKIAGCKVIQGEIRRNARIRVFREKEEIFEGEISSLKHEKDDVRDVKNGFECGISAKEFNNFSEGDIIEAYVTELIAIE